ncbi:MAG: heme biosynthesis protein HemY, partial [Devosiaceae bacterium]|nr:heme biosynthesis protein HemY [Devosiaceae bacterium]
LKRAKELIGEKSDDAQIALVLANAAINAYEWSMARNILAPFISNPSQNICLALAQIEEGQNADEGKARNWLAKAVHASRDFAWIGDGIISDVWEPISPVSGNFDVFEWKTPPSAIVTKQFKGATASPKEQLEDKSPSSS